MYLQICLKILERQKIAFSIFAKNVVFNVAYSLEYENVPYTLVFGKKIVKK